MDLDRIRNPLPSLALSSSSQMVREGKVGHSSNFKKRVRSKHEGSDDSDEDYVVSDDGNEESDDDAEDYADNGTYKDIATSAMHTLLAACGLEHTRSEVHVVPPPSNCTHIERVAAEQASLMSGCCMTCFDSFVKDVVKKIMDTRSRQWLSLGL